MKLRILSTSIAAFALVSACGSKSTELPLPSNTEKLAGEACANFARIGCPEASGSPNGIPCVQVLVTASKLRELPLFCWGAAPNVETARMCGSGRDLRCTR